MNRDPMQKNVLPVRCSSVAGTPSAIRDERHGEAACSAFGRPSSRAAAWTCADGDGDDDGAYPRRRCGRNESAVRARASQGGEGCLVIPTRPSASRRHQDGFCLFLCYLIVFTSLGGPSGPRARALLARCFGVASNASTSSSSVCARNRVVRTRTPSFF